MASTAHGRRARSGRRRRARAVCGSRSTTLRRARASTVALSGGADSLALAACLAFVAPQAGWDCRRGRRRPRTAARLGRRSPRGRPSRPAASASTPTSSTVEVGARRRARSRRSRPRGTPRCGRVAVDAVLLGHTLDDQAETVLLGLGRGSGPRSIAGMPAVDGPFRRPFLGLRRADTERICAASGLDRGGPTRTTPTRGFRRSRLRHEVLPLLEDVLDGGVVEALGSDRRPAARRHRPARRARRRGGRPVRRPDAGRRCPPALRSRVLRRAALEAGADGSELAAVPPGRARPSGHRLARSGPRRAAGPHQRVAGRGRPAFRPDACARLTPWTSSTSRTSSTSTRS